MSEEPKKLGAHLQGRPAEEFPPATFPTVFADGVASYARGPGFVKFYLYRVDPNMFGRGGSVSTPFAQVVMSSLGFGQATALFERALKEVIKAGELTEEQVEKFRKDITDINEPKEPTRE